MSVNNNNPPIAVVITVILLVFFVVGILTVYFCRCFLANVMATWHHRRGPSGAIVGTTTNARSLGLDSERIQALPAFKYCTVKDFRREKFGLECAICLAEFRDEDLLRLLTTCCHVFHQECVDLWLESHTTCPVCRSDLDVSEETLTRSPILVRSNSVHEIPVSSRPLEDAICIDIKEDGRNEVKRKEESSSQAGPPSCLDKKERLARFLRSHSTGHSMTRNREEEQDRYTLRLPDNVKINIIRGHNYAVSCITFGDFSSPSDTSNRGFGELSRCSETSNSIQVV